MKPEDIRRANAPKFDKVRLLGLPIGEYAITSSGPLGVRNLRVIHDIDIIVTPSLWDELASRYRVEAQDDRVERIILEGGLIEVLGKHSFFAATLGHGLTEEERIAKAEVIDGLPFEPLEIILYYKHFMARPKDIVDIALIEEYLRGSKHLNV